jgi:ectoine hydroxylase-related dioxygenase (phytanoyl-CoA dioxygenase family)
LLCNICIDEFTAQNGATMFALGSASEGTAPPSEWEGLSILEQVPAGGPSGSGVDRKAEQLVAPAGTIILYDCRTWHRQHANLSQQPRSCLLTIFTPRWVLPAHGDQTRMRNAMLSAPGLTARETERLIHLLGDSNAAVENWPVVRSTLPDEHEAVEGNGSTTPGHQELADTRAWRQASKL